MNDRRTLDHFTGCLIGGAVGDALGAPIEFTRLPRIRMLYGEQGVTDYDTAYGRRGAITDDTQMTLFTAEGLILSKARQEYAGPDNIVLAVYHAYLRWLYTQDAQIQKRLIKGYGTCSIVDGVLTGYKELHCKRAPGNTCLSALRSGNIGNTGSPINNSKGCGGVMRTAPVGLAFPDAEEAFDVGCECAALTHGHPSGYLASGAAAALIADIIAGASLEDAVDNAVRILKTRRGMEECLRAVETALEYVSKGEESPETIEKIGAGWLAEEALAMSIYAAMIAGGDFSKGVLLAVNHSGDSDSTGAVTGNFLGALYGVGRIPEKWKEELELNDVITEISFDLFERFGMNISAV